MDRPEGERHEGGCLCGAIRYQTQGPALKVTICHCRFCQRATGAGFMINANFTQAAHRVTKGAPRVFDHRSEGSGKILHVHFCPDCGTKLHMTFERAPGYVGIYAGTFDTPGWITFDRVTAKQIFLDAARPDMVILPGIRAFAAHETANDGTPCVAHVFDHAVTVAEGWPPEQAMR